jgi:catechol 2,3-dioxygenase-like lactoylglutathione lyase family enzyme
MAATENTNTESELRGINHLALVCRDMAETVAWYEDVLGMKLVKPLELPDARHKADYDAAVDGGDAFIRSMYFRDPNGTMLEFACWTTTLDETDVRHAPARAATKV